MKLTKTRLAEIIKEEVSMLQTTVSEEDETEDSGPQTGDAEKIALKAEKLLGPLFERINNVREFEEVMTVFLNMASKKIKPNVVKKVLVGLAREATQ